MSIDTGKVSGRRVLRLETMDDLLAEADRLATGKTRRLGNWSLGQSLEHLAASMNGSIDGLGFTAPWWLRMLGPLMKKGMINKPMRSGFQLPDAMAEKLVPDADITVEKGLADFRSAVERLGNEPKRVPNAVLGRLTRQEWDRFHLRHAEMHLSFVSPQDA